MMQEQVVRFRVSRHAADQYRQRVLGCPERGRSDDLLKRVIAEQVRASSMRRSGGSLVVECGPLLPKARDSWQMTLAQVTYSFVIEDGVVVTTLGYRMRASKKVARKSRVRRALDRRLGDKLERIIIEQNL